MSHNTLKHSTTVARPYFEDSTTVASPYIEGTTTVAQQGTPTVAKTVSLHLGKTSRDIYHTLFNMRLLLLSTETHLPTLRVHRNCSRVCESSAAQLSGQRTCMWLARAYGNCACVESRACLASLARAFGKRYLSRPHG